MMAACRKMQGAIARDHARPEDVAVTSHHVRSCADCRAHERVRASVREGILAANDNLDDLTRARVLARVLEGRRLQQAGVATARRPASRVWIGWTLAFSAVMVLAVTGVWRSRNPGAGTSSLTPLALEPYAVHGGAVPGSSSRAGGGLDRIELPARASMRARLGPSADFVLLGPLELAVRDADDRRSVVELRRGTLIGDFDGSSGRRLRITTADATVDIVGTHFLVEASPQRTLVSVEHGRVRVESHGQVRMVGGGQEWSTDQAAVEPLAAERAALFQRTARGSLEDLLPEPPAAPAATVPAAAGAPAMGQATLARADIGGGASKRERTVRSTGSRRNIAVRVDVSRSPSTRPTEVHPVDSPSVAPASTGPSPTPAMPAVAPIAARAPAPVLPKETAASLYHRAEIALRQGDDAGGKKLLDELVRVFPGQPATESARYELALMAEKAGQSSEALAQADELLRVGTSGPFVEPAQFLRCRVYVARDRASAAACLTRFVREFPHSPHDEAALRALIELSRESGRCMDVTRFADLYLQRHRGASFAGEAERARSQCDR